MDELDVIKSIYSDLVEFDEEYFTIAIPNRSDSTYDSLLLRFPLPMNEDYPSETIPAFSLKSSWLKTDQRKHMEEQLEGMFEQGEPVIFEWVEWLAENIPQSIIDSNEIPDESTLQESNITKSMKPITPVIVPTIYSGEAFVDRKSVFIAHVARVKSVEEVNIVLNELKSDKKIQKATHNMYAYRFMNESTGLLTQDNDDDGETAAGRRMAHLLSLMEAKDVLCVVSRWFGGVKLGGDRFRHINNVARIVIEKHGFSGRK